MGRPQWALAFKIYFILYDDSYAVEIIFLFYREVAIDEEGSAEADEGAIMIRTDPIQSRDLCEAGVVVVVTEDVIATTARTAVSPVTSELQDFCDSAGNWRWEGSLSRKTVL